MSMKKHVHHGRSSAEHIDGGKVLLAAGLSAGLVFLDAGCGDGFLSLAAAGIVGPKGFVYSVDVFEESLAGLAREISAMGIENARTLRADLTGTIPLEAGSVDFCALANVLHGFVANGEDERALSGISRVLKPGGSLLVIEFVKTRGTGVDESLDLRGGPPGPSQSERLSEEETGRAVAPHGFRAERVFSAGPFHYAALFTKSRAG
jgi:ubiquinone/menaquinone biosynthesis C-methylase UbiE